MPNGEQIAHSVGANTFVEVIEKLGIEKVKNLGDKVGRFPLISTSKSHHRQRQSGQYYIMCSSSTAGKKRRLEKLPLSLASN